MNFDISARQKQESAPMQSVPSLTLKPRLAVIVPYRDRAEHLAEFIPKISRHLLQSGIPFHVFVIEQANDFFFNRGMLLNIGVSLAQEYDYFAFHDVDLIPEANVNYSYRHFPVHLATEVSHLEFKLPYPDYIGGVTLVSKDVYLKVNGHSNDYWGWGVEDDDFFLRLEINGIGIEHAPNSRYVSLPHSGEHRYCGNPRYSLNKTKLRINRENKHSNILSGMSTLSFDVKDVAHESAVSHFKVSFAPPAPQPKISAACLTYARVELLEEAVECFLRQTYPNRELVILNTCTEQTLVYDHPLIKIINLNYRPETLGDCRNILNSHCTGEWIVTWDDDDIYLPDYLASYALETVGDAQWARVHGHFCITTASEAIWSAESIPPQLAYRRDLWEKHRFGKLNTLEDVDFSSRIEGASRGAVRSETPNFCFFIYRRNGKYPHLSTIVSSEHYQRSYGSYSDFTKTLFEKKEAPRGLIALRPQLRGDYQKQLESAEIAKLIEADHPSWSASLTVFVKTKRVQSSHGDWADLLLFDEGRLELKWDNWGIERFVLIGLRYQATGDTIANHEKDPQKWRGSVNHSDGSWRS